MAAVVLAVACWVVLGSGAFSVRHVTIVGADRATAAQIATVTRSAVGESMLTISTGGLRSRIAAMPGVASVRVHRDWPNTLQVTVIVRRPVLAVHRPSGWLLVDRNGAAYATVARLPAHVLPVSFPADVSRISTSVPVVRAALDVITALPSTVRRKVVAVAAPSAAGIRLQLRDGAVVVWGAADDSARKARALAVLLSRHAHVYDVSTPGFVTTSH